MKFSHFALAAAATLAVLSCKERKSETQNGESVQVARSSSEMGHWPYFDGTYPMVVTTQEARMEYLCRHSWDTFNFADTLSLRQDSSAVLSEFAGFVQTLNSYGVTDKVDIITDLMTKASASRAMLEWFAWQAGEVLADPNSPIRDEELYIAVLRAQLATGFYDFAERTRLDYKLQLALKNRVGQKANDFTYTLESGAKRRMYGVSSRYLLIFFNNPGCPMCRSICDELKASVTVGRMVADGSLTILAMYPDEDRTEWVEHRKEFPSAWIYAYDADCTIRRGSLYDISAIPSLYLLDKEKTVLLKDITDVTLLESTLSGPTAPAIGGRL